MSKALTQNNTSEETINSSSNQPLIMQKSSNLFEIGWKVKIFIIIIMIIIFISIWYFYIKTPINNSSPTIPDKFPDLPKNPNSPALYIMSKNTGKLYMKDINGSYWDAGFSADCPVIAADYNTIVIDDVYAIYNQKTLPDKYKNVKECKNLTENSYCSVLIQTKEQYENDIIKNIKGKYIPDSVTCTFSNNNKISGNQPSNTDFGKLMLSVLKYAYMTPYEFLKSHIKELGELVKNVTPIIAVSVVLGKFAETRMLVPLVAPFFIMEQALASGNMDAIKEASIQSSFLLFKSGIEKAIQIMKAGEAGEGAGLSLEASETSELVEAAVQESAAASTEIMSAMSTSLEFLGAAAATLDIIMISGMIFDMIDPCGLNKGYIDQDGLNKLKETYDKALFINTNGLSYPTIWNARFNCEYSLDPNIYWKQCMTPDEQSKISAEDYAKDFNDKVKKYSKEYLNSLKVNSQGECLKSGTNKDLQNYLEQLIPSVDWSSIGNLTKDDIKNIKLPMNDTLNKLDLLFTNNNVVVASYINHYWYFVLIFIIVLIIIIVFV